MWIVLAWLAGVVVALFLIEKEDRAFWVRHGYSGSELNRALEAYMWQKAGITLFSWVAVVSIVKIAADDKRIARKVDSATKECHEAIRRLEKELEKTKKGLC